MNFFCIIATLVFSIIISILFYILNLTIRIFAGKSINSPEYAPVHATIFFLFFHGHDIYDHETEIARKTPTFRLLAPGQSEIFTVDPRNVEHILKTRFDNYSKGQYARDILSDLLGHGIFAVDGDKWRQQRKLSSFEFSTRVLRDFSCSVFRGNAAKLAGVFMEYALSGQPFDAQDLLMRCTMESIFEVGFGVSLRCLEGMSIEGKEFMKAFDEANTTTSFRFVDPLWKLKRCLNIGSEAKLKRDIATIDNFVCNLIRTKRRQLSSRQESDGKEDILSRFLAESDKDPETMNDKYMRDIILNFMIAGKDTSAAALSWFLYIICKNPLIQEKIAQEVREVTGSEGETMKTEDFIQRITEESLDKMHYLHAALSETLRLYPPVPVDMRCAESDDILPDGYRVNKGDNVYYIAYAMGRMTTIWGEDAEVFRPERLVQESVWERILHTDK
ncbi:PREDICTED: cytochrome P450 704C1-like isoform X2 [Tarenaya hassleriana]|uniref:cytochrome P450 704C1-like isoform X2 n=1 Tax=Tarenaya hassleriana TaxID=28532 RepID=UPI00053C90D5|nr:PREDICTED: cytochrome P450 704C1-like isoform X2 [Tarenaya hassleriana]